MSNRTEPSNQNQSPSKPTGMSSPKGWYVPTSGSYGNAATTDIIRVSTTR